MEYKTEIKAVPAEDKGVVTAMLRLMTLFLWGGFIYFLIELIYRGYSRLSMFVVGPGFTE